MLISLLAGLTSTLRTRASLQVEILALRHQLAVLQRSKPKQVVLRPTDRLLWVALSRLWPEWRRALMFVKSETRAPRKPGTAFEPYGSTHSQYRPSPCLDFARTQTDDDSSKEASSSGNWDILGYSPSIRTRSYDNYAASR